MKNEQRYENTTRLTNEQRRQVRAAVEEAYHKLRWRVGDSHELLAELYVLARDSFIEGVRQERAATRHSPAQNVGCRDETAPPDRQLLTFRTPCPFVIPNALPFCHSERSEESLNIERDPSTWA
jgi:hypothetical protein